MADADRRTVAASTDMYRNAFIFYMVVMGLVYNNFKRRQIAFYSVRANGFHASDVEAFAALQTSERVFLTLRELTAI